LNCYSQKLSDTLLDGTGSLYACTLVHAKLDPGQRTAHNYWVAHVDLDAGPRIQGILSPDINEPHIGMRLNIALETLRVDEDGRETVVFHFRHKGDLK